MASKVKPTFHVQEQYDSKLITDHEYDGIMELDNDLPPWLMWLFYGTMFFGAFYWVHFHTFGIGPSQAEEYALESEAYEKTYNVANDNAFNESAVALYTDQARVAAGKEHYLKAGCNTCHGGAGEGIVGPNLTDAYWIHGGSPSDVFKMLKYGNLAKGMPSYSGQFSDEQIVELASYLQTFQGTQPANPKAAEGELYSGAAPAQAPAATDSATEAETPADSLAPAQEPAAEPAQG